MAASSWRPRLPAAARLPGLRRAGRVAGTLAAGVAAVGASTYHLAERALVETVPYGPDGGRRRGPLPLWAAALGGWVQPLGCTTAASLAEAGYPELLQALGPDGLGPVPAANVCTTWFVPLDSDGTGLIYQAPFQRAVQDSMVAVVQALHREAEEMGFGRGVLEHGFHLIVVPSQRAIASAVPGNAIVLSAGMLRSCLASSSRQGQPDYPAAVAALQSVLAHEAAHLYLNHVEEALLFRATRLGYRKAAGFLKHIPWMRGMANRLWQGPVTGRPSGIPVQHHISKWKELCWQHEFEADEVACALLARLRLSPQHMAAGVQMLHAEYKRELLEEVRQLCDMQQKLSASAKQQLASDLGFPDADFEAGLARYKAAADRGDVDALTLLQSQLEARQQRRQLVPLAGLSSDPTNGSSPQVYAVGNFWTGLHPCPAAAAEAALADLSATHPPVSARLAHIRQLAGGRSMAMLATAPPGTVGDRVTSGSVADHVAEQLVAGLRAEAAARLAAATGDVAIRPSTKQLARRAAAATAVAVGATAAAGAVAAVAAAASRQR